MCYRYQFGFVLWNLWLMVPLCSGGWTISGTPLDLSDPRILAIAEAERTFLEAEYDEYASSNASGAAFCRSAALIVSHKFWTLLLELICWIPWIITRLHVFKLALTHAHTCIRRSLLTPCSHAHSSLVYNILWKRGLREMKKQGVHAIIFKPLKVFHFPVLK